MPNNGLFCHGVRVVESGYKLGFLIPRYNKIVGNSSLMAALSVGDAGTGRHIRWWSNA